jgi:hypothetical protein
MARKEEKKTDVRGKDKKHKYRGKNVKKKVKENVLKRKSVIPTWGWGFLTYKHNTEISSGLNQ